MSFVSTFIQATVTGIVNGGIIAIGAVGLTLSYGMTTFINFAYGEYLTYGAYIVFVAGIFFGSTLLFPVAVLIGMAAVALLAVVLSKVFFRPLSDRGPFPAMLTSIGLAFVLRYLLTIPARYSVRSYDLPVLRSIDVAGVFISPISIGLLAISVITMVLIHIMLQYTMLGKKMRAVSDNTDLARVSGIDSDNIIRATWIISGATAALAGVLFAIQFSPFTPLLGWTFLVPLFAATILGGIGRPYGAMIGAMIIGLVIAYGATFLTPTYSLAYSFVVLVLVMLFKPEGIAGGII
jgi:neutral amino acid transport system permease protein